MPTTQQTQETLIKAAHKRATDMGALIHLAHCIKEANIKHAANDKDPSYATMIDMANTLRKLGDAYANIVNYKKARGFYHKYYEDLVSLTEQNKKTNDEVYIHVVHINKGQVTDYPVTVYLNIINKNEENHNIISSCKNIANIDYLMHNYESAISYYKDALDRETVAHDVILKMVGKDVLASNDIDIIRNLIDDQHNIGKIYFEQRDYENAFLYYWKALELKLKVASQTGEAVESLSIFASHSDIAIAYYVKEDYKNSITEFKSAIAYLDKACTVALQSNMPKINNAIGNIHLMLSNIYSETNNIEEHDRHYNIAMKAFDPVHLAVLIGDSYDNLLDGSSSIG